MRFSTCKLKYRSKTPRILRTTRQKVTKYTYVNILEAEGLVAIFLMDSNDTGADALIGFLWNQCAILVNTSYAIYRTPCYGLNH